MAEEEKKSFKKVLTPAERARKWRESVKNDEKKKEHYRVKNLER